MSAFNINTYYGCEACEAANEYGNGCKHGLLFPVLLVMAIKGNAQIIDFKERNSMSYKDRIELEQLLGSFVTSPKSLLSEKEVKLLRKAMRLIGRVNKRYADLYM